MTEASRSVFRLAVVVALIVGSACGKSASAGDPGSDSSGGRAGRGGRAGGRGGSSDVPVSSTTAIEKSLPVTVSSVGSAEASTTVEVRPQVTGQLTTVAFAEGQEVKKGEVLFTIDPRPFEAAVKQAEAVLAKDAAQAENAQAMMRRSDDLLKRQIVSQADHDTAVATARALTETTNVDQAAVDTAKLNLQYTRITAPVSGRAGAVAARPGSLVRTSDADPLVVINQITPIRVTFVVPGTYLPQIRSADREGPLIATAKPSGSKEPEAAGELAFIDNSIDAGTGTIRLKANFANDDRRFWPGEFLDVTLQLSVDPHAIVVPAAAVQNGQQGTFVFVIGADRTVAMRTVVVARTTADTAVISSGLKAGEEVVTDGQLRLTPGVKVSVKPPVGGGGGRASGTGPS